MVIRKINRVVRGLEFWVNLILGRGEGSRSSLVMWLVI